jgi:uncharacterized protein involved in response to NO
MRAHVWIFPRCKQVAAAAWLVAFASFVIVHGPMLMRLE